MAKDLPRQRMRPKVRPELKKMNLVGPCSTPVCGKHTSLLLRVRGPDLAQTVDVFTSTVAPRTEWKARLHTHLLRRGEKCADQVAHVKRCRQVSMLFRQATCGAYARPAR